MTTTTPSPVIVDFFNGISGSPISNLLWNFGDGTTSTSLDATISHVYTLPGDYTTSLSAYSIYGKYGDRTQVVIAINPAPAPFSYFAFGLDNGTDPKLYGSSDLSIFEDCGVLPVDTARVIYGNGMLVALVLTNFFSGIYDLYYSSDLGKTWTQIDYPNPRHMSGLDFVNGYFLSLNTYDNKIWYSSDGVNWDITAQAPGHGSSTVKFFYFKGAFCALLNQSGSNEEFWTGVLTPGGSWTSTSTGSSNMIISDETIAVSGTYIVAIFTYLPDNVPVSIYSTNGTNWNIGPDFSEIHEHKISVTHINNQFWFNFETSDESDWKAAIPDDNILATPVFLESDVVFNPPILFEKDNIFYGILTILGPDNKIYHNADLTTDNWISNSTGIPSTVGLKQFLL